MVVCSHFAFVDVLIELGLLHSMKLPLFASFYTFVFRAFSFLTSGFYLVAFDPVISFNLRSKAGSLESKTQRKVSFTMFDGLELHIQFQWSSMHNDVPYKVVGVN